MKREREGEEERESERERDGGERGEGQMGKVGGRGNTGTSHELNRTANSSTRVGEEGRDGSGGWQREGILLRGGAERGGEGGDRSLLHYATHTYTHTKKTGHKLHFRSKLRLSSDASVLPVFTSRDFSTS